MPTVMISCGEASGDLYAGALASELRRLSPGVRLLGFGGDRLQAAGHRVHLIGGALEDTELDAKRAIDQATRLAAAA